MTVREGTNKVLKTLGGKQAHFVWLLPIAFYLGCIGSVKLLRYIDPTAGSFDTGIWQVAIVPFVFVLICLICTMLILRFNLPSKFTYLIKGQSADDFNNNLTAWQRTLSSAYWFTLIYGSLLVLILKLI